MHTHKCGFWAGNNVYDYLEHVAAGNIPKGCGHEWSHGDLSVEAVGEERAVQEHICPSCGAGPWPLQVNEHTSKALQVLREVTCKVLGART